MGTNCSKLHLAETVVTAEQLARLQKLNLAETVVTAEQLAQFTAAAKSQRTLDSIVPM